MGKVTSFYGTTDNVGVGALKHGAEDYPEVPILDGVTLDDRHRAQSEFGSRPEPTAFALLARQHMWE